MSDEEKSDAADELISFKFTAMDGDGKERKGTFDAPNDVEAARMLKAKGLFPVSIVEAKGSRESVGAGSLGTTKPGKKKKKKKKKFSLDIQIGAPVLKTKILCQTTRQLSTLLNAGLPLVASLRTLHEQCGKLRDYKLLKTILEDVLDEVEGGGSLSDALNHHKKSFDNLYVNMIKAGEASGALEEVLNRLAEYMEKSERLRKKVKAALTYPLVVLFIATTITVGLMIGIVPKFAVIFGDMLGSEGLPPLTQFVMGISKVLTDHYIIMFVPLFALIVFFKWFKGTRRGAFLVDLIALKMPPFNSIVVKTNVARFCQTLGTLLNAGVPMLNALQIVRDSSTNELIRRAVQTVHDAVKQGEGIAKPLEMSRIFPIMVVRMVAIGEQTGALPDMLNRISITYNEEVDNAVDSLTSMIEPIMIVFLAIIVGGIVLALFMPLIKMVEVMSQ